VRLVLIGLVAGFFSALFGVGGGIVIVPLLLFCGWDSRAATATSLAAIGITAVSGVIAYAIHGDVNVGYAALVGLPAAVVGSGRDCVAATSADAHGRVALRRFHPRRSRLAVRQVTYALAIALGLVAGVLAGMFGIGGGLLFVPTLIALGLGHHEALGTSLLAIVPTVLVGTWRQARYGNVRWRAAVVLGIAAAAAAQGGVALAVSLPDATLRRLFAGLLVLVAVQIAWRARQRES